MDIVKIVANLNKIKNLIKNYCTNENMAHGPVHNYLVKRGPFGDRMIKML